MIMLNRLVRLWKSRPRTYQDWVDLYDTLSDADRAEIRAHLASLAHQPPISIVMPVYEPPLEPFRAAIASIMAQLYSNWELCIADDASPSPRIADILRDISHNEPRIEWMRRETNGHISHASNSALALATGEFVAPMDHATSCRNTLCTKSRSNSTRIRMTMT